LKVSAVQSRGEANGLFANLAKSHVIFFSSEHARRHLRHSFREAGALGRRKPVISLVEKELLKQTPRGHPVFRFRERLMFGSPL
jgi:hypothetical protein